MEEQNVQVEEGIRLSDIFRLLLSKIKYLVLAIVIGGILGGVFAVWRTYDVNYYGTSVEFYVNPENPTEGTNNESQYGVYGAYGRHVMDNMIKLLSSESFIEKMILGGTDLPAKEGWATPAEEEALGLKDKLTVAENADLDGIQSLLESALSVKNDKYETYTDKLSDLHKEWEKLYESDDVKNKNFNEAEYATLDVGDAKFQLLHNTYDAMKEAKASYQLASEDYDEKRQAKQVAGGLIEEALDAWRQTAKYKATLAKYDQALSFSYLQSEDDTADANNLARSFIYVKISVLNDKALANELLGKVKTLVPAYVEENMTVPAGYQGTNCQRITRTDDIYLTNPRYTTKQAVKYGLAVGAAALLIVCVVIIILDKSDKRLRDTEIITKTFNVPLLGIVPSIEELKVEANAKKKAEQNSTEVK